MSVAKALISRRPATSGRVVAIVAAAALSAVGVVRGVAHAQTPPGPARSPAHALTAVPSTPSAVPTTIRAPRPPGAPVLVRKSRRSGRVRLVYELGKGSATCDSEALFRQLVASELSEPDPFVLTGPEEAVLTVRLERDPPGFRGTVELRDLAGNVLERSERVERTCNDAADRAIILLMLRVFPSPPEEPAPAAGAPEAPGAQPGSEEVVKALRELRARLDAAEETIEKQGEALVALQKALEEERKRKMDLTFALSAGALITANLTSNVGPGVWLGGDVRTGPLSLGLEARAVLPAPVFLGSYDFDVSQLVALLTPCGRYSVIFGCAVAGAGVEIHHDAGAPGGDTKSGPVLQIGGRLGVEVPFGDLPLGGRAWGEVLYSAPQAGSYYDLGDGAKLQWWRPDVSAFFGLGLVFKFGNESSNQGMR